MTYRIRIVFPRDAFNCADCAVCRNVSVCLSVPQSVDPPATIRYCVKTAEHIVKMLSQHANLIILVLCEPNWIAAN